MFLSFSSKRYHMLYPEGEYENFFVCNYGVGGNVPGQPIYNTECTEDIGENKIKTQGIKIETISMFEKGDIGFKDIISEGCSLASYGTGITFLPNRFARKDEPLRRHVRDLCHSRRPHRDPAMPSVHQLCFSKHSGGAPMPRGPLPNP